MTATGPDGSSALDDRSLALRRLAVDTLEGGARGHIGSTMSLIEIIRVLYDDILRFDPANPDWPGRDRFLLSKGHGCIAQYVVLADKGFFPKEELLTFCRYPSILGGHPEHGHVPGVEASTGSLGHGLAIGVGMAHAARIRKTDTRVYVVVGDGECDEGSIWESAIAAGHHKMGNLTVIVDYNKLQSYGRVAEIWDLEPLAAKWESFGFDCVEVDGHSVDQLRAALQPDPNRAKPLAVVAHTVKGKGIPFAEGEPAWHHKSSLKAEDIESMRAALAPSVS